MKYMLLFCADEDAWMALPEDERNDAVGRIGAWFGRHAQAGTIVEGHRLAGRAAARNAHWGRRDAAGSLG